ncbi:TetR/AcrR family transcriptional regulator [Streptomyces reniochalinae]|uniref:TetR/AcrR family transcriptional regulator n=1 Tax=Streptomyces reniochalinae TaxID=2250578 RepID=A0A367E7H2_9ACTN|nr:TetR/AcrR family transcriptional regulator [Streptomyces reniochalinae]
MSAPEEPAGGRESDGEDGAEGRASAPGEPAERTGNASAAPRGRGRPARRGGEDGPGTRELILASARGEFAERGYDKASVRAIARGAGVDAALVHHYFGPKEQVFAAAVEGALAPALAVPGLIEGAAPGEVGEAVTRTFLGMWEDRGTREPVLAIVRSAVNNERAAAVFRELLSRNLIARVAAHLGEADARLRVNLAAAQLVGTAILRYVIRLEPLASEPVSAVIGRLAPVVQQHLTGPAPRADTGAAQGGGTEGARCGGFVQDPDSMSGS